MNPKKSLVPDSRRRGGYWRRRLGRDQAAKSPEQRYKIQAVERAT